MANFAPIFAPTERRPRSQFSRTVKANTWLAIGALMQSALVLVLPIRFAVLPTIFYLTTRLIDSISVWSGRRINPHMARVVPGKTSAQVPGSTTPSQNPVVVIKLSLRSNHPLGILHPHMRKISTFFRDMMADLDKHSEQYGYLGATATWPTSERRPTRS